MLGTKRSVLGLPDQGAALDWIWEYFQISKSESAVIYNTGAYSSRKVSLNIGRINFSTVHNLKAEHSHLITYTGDNLVLSRDFLEWFRGFTDAEGCFLVSPNKASSFTFKFKIKLHIDDLNVLNFIKDNLNIGKVIVSKSKPEATFEVNLQSEIAVIVAIFSKYNLNSTKHLNFLGFSHAFLIYMENNSREARSEVNNYRKYEFY